MISLSAIIKEGISISRGITTSSPYIREYGVAPIAILSLILYAHEHMVINHANPYHSF